MIVILAAAKFGFRRGAGVVERGGLENRCGTCYHREFESLPLRSTSLSDALAKDSFVELRS